MSSGGSMSEEAEPEFGVFRLLKVHSATISVARNPLRVSICGGDPTRTSSGLEMNVIDRARGVGECAGKGNAPSAPCLIGRNTVVDDVQPSKSREDMASHRTLARFRSPDS